MKMELTNELKEPSHDLKERFFMQYYMQQVQWNENGNTPMLVTGRHIYRTSYLSLRHLSSITSAELNELSNLLQVIPEYDQHIASVDWYRGKSFLIPFMGIPVQRWIEWGVVKLKEV